MAGRGKYSILATGRAGNPAQKMTAPSTNGYATAMWPPRRFPGTPPQAVEALPDPPSVAVVALNRMAFGPRPGDIDAFLALGANDNQRLTAYVEEQLYPDQINDTETTSRLNAAGLITLNQTVEQLWANYVTGSGNRYRPFYEVRSATFLRAVYSERQLLEVLAGFWHNHFNVYGRDYWIAPVLPHYDRAVIRGNALGNFREMLDGVAKSTAMLYYLDNYTSPTPAPTRTFPASSSNSTPWAPRTTSESCSRAMSRWIPRAGPSVTWMRTSSNPPAASQAGASTTPRAPATPVPSSTDRVARPFPEERARHLHSPGPARSERRP